MKLRRPSWSAMVASVRRSGPRGLLLVAAIALGLSFTDPGIRWPQRQHDLLVVLDVTQSMEVADLLRDGEPVTRLSQARRALAQVLRQLPCGSRVGWGLFTEYRSFLLLEPVEVCEHQRELLGMLSHIDARMAWTGNSEIAKGLYSGLKIAKALPSKPALVFVTDGQEAPPVHPQYRPSSEGAVRVVPGLIVGVGGDKPAPIPKLDPEGRIYGYWDADEVMQRDPRSFGRGGSVAGEQMADEVPASEAATVGATPGTEHLSSLREPYLQLLASETGLAYHRLGDPEALYRAMTDADLAHPVVSRMDLRWSLALLALLAVLAVYLPWRTLMVRLGAQTWRGARERPARTDRSTRSSLPHSS